MNEASWADWITAIGTMLAGLAGVAAVIIGALTARAWRVQARAAKEAEVAGDALAAVLQYTSTMRRLALPYRTVPQMTNAVQDRWEAEARPTETALKLVTGRAMAYLPQAANDLLLEILRAGNELHADQWAWGIQMDVGTAEKEDHTRVFGQGRADAFTKLEERAISALRALARIEQ